MILYVYLACYLVLLVYWIVYYLAESNHDHVTTLMLHYGSFENGTGEPRFERLREEWHDWDALEKLSTLVITTLGVAVVTEWVFAILIFVWSVAMRWILHEGFMAHLQKEPLWDGDASANFVDRLLLWLQTKFSLSNNTIERIMYLPAVVTNILVIWYIAVI